MHNEEWRRDYSRLHFYRKVVESASFRMWNIIWTYDRGFTIYQQFSEKCMIIWIEEK